MLEKFLQPRIRDRYSGFLLVILVRFIPFLMGLRNDVPHVLVLESAHNSEEETTLRQLTRQLLGVWKVLGEHGILHSVGVEVFHGDFLVEGHLHQINLVLFEMRFLFRKNVAQEANPRPLDAGKEYVC